MTTDISPLLHLALANNASDVHLSAGTLPRLRILGEVTPIPGSSLLTPTQVDTFRAKLFATATSSLGNFAAVPSPTHKSPTAPSPDDFTHIDPSTTRRFRVNAYSTIRGPALAIRVIPEKISSLADISAPDIIHQLLLRPRGLILVTGPTGSGKSATLAAMIDHINRERSLHILTLEDPVEYVHQDNRSLISQRELPSTRGYIAALKAAVREDPDVILVGEMRDPDTIRLCLTAAETGHLVFSTLHTRSAHQAVDRIIDVFPAGEKEAVRTMLSASLEGVIAQQLVRHADGQRRIAVFETLQCTPAVRNAIKDGKTSQIAGIMQTGRESGMETLDQALANLVVRGHVTAAEARRVASDPSRF